MLNSKKTIFILGLRRSGTTIFWKTLRQDKNLLCFDEPFNPNLINLPKNNSKNTYDEFISLFNKSNHKFTSSFAPITPENETDSSLSKREKNYIKWLTEQNDTVLFDAVRLNFKLNELYNIFPHAFIIHLHRAPAAWASSHLQPSGKTTWKRTLANIYRKHTFWDRSGFYNNYHYQTIIEKMLRNKEGNLFSNEAIDTQVIQKQPAVGRLIAFWLASFSKVEREGQQLFKNRFISLRFEDFCDKPELIMNNIYNHLDLPMPNFDLKNIRNASHGYHPESLKWQKLFKQINVPSSESNRATRQ